MHSNNHYFGHATLLAEYAGRVDPPPVWGTLQHGWNPGTGFPSDQRFLPGLPRFVWAQHNLTAATEAGMPRVLPIGAPFLYLGAQSSEAAPPNPENTIAYPAHRWEAQRRTLHPHEGFARALEEREGQSVTVCLFFLEYDDPDIRRVYEERGFRVICHGNRHETSFLHRQRNELLCHRRLVANRLSSAVWYGAHLGLEIELYELGEEVAARSDFQRYLPMVGERIGPDDAIELGRRELGWEFLRSPSELSEALGWKGSRRIAGPLLRSVFSGAKRLAPKRI